MQRELSIGRGMRGLLALVACIGLLVSLPSCGAPSDPSPPPRVDPPPPPPPPPPPSPIASLAIEQLTFLPLRNDGLHFGYDVRFQLRETSGNSGATIKNVLVGDLRGGGDNTGPSCWVVPLRVPPGGVLDTFFTDAGRDWLGYCGVGAGFPTQEARVVVDFADDDGRIGFVEVIAKAPR